MSWSLGSDNHSGIHPQILSAIQMANVEHAHSYGMDEISEAAKSEWKRVLGRDADTFYVFNGTAANVLSLQTFLRPFEAVVTSEVAHIHLDECGAPEKHLGSKVYALPSADGRIKPQQLHDLLSRGGDQHFASPKIVSLTLPTELGVCYSLDELKEWRKFATQHRLFLHWDGARLANAACHHQISIASLIEAGQPDVISFGGTKNGLLGGEAIVVFDSERAQDLKYIRKQGMQLSSKTRFLAAQFNAYLSNDLWKTIAEHVSSEAQHLAGALREFPEIRIAFPVHSNALFVELPKRWINPIRNEFFFYIWDIDKSMARWMISWDWQRTHTENLLNLLRGVKKECPV
jgi:threonine aldolase